MNDKRFYVLSAMIGAIIGFIVGFGSRIHSDLREIVKLLEAMQ